ncbi:MAG: hypothetical protein BGP16_04740 [Sphingobium sp. 66-54]|nr:MAG: hypothetical protein BGP16_04740 [Sphingobium sp. 66-54]
MAQRIDARLGEKARSMRNDAPEPERRLWSRLRASQLGFKFRRQAVVLPYIVDFLCPWNGLVVEVDGDTHVHEQDRARDAALNRLGYTVLRFSNADVMSQIDGIVEIIHARAVALPERSWNTHPTPSFGREGLSQ